MVGGASATATSIALVVFVCAGTLLLSPSPAAAKTPRQRSLDRTLKEVRRECESKACLHLAEDEAGNCVHECVSPLCFDKIYGAEPLEPGEVDHVRARQFNACTKREGIKEQEGSKKERHKKNALANR